MKNNIFQIMRGVCIISVVITHVIDKNYTNPNYEVALIMQNIVNIAVTGFVFLAGYFINIEDVTTNAKKFIVRKSQRILIPYVFWSVFYVLTWSVLFHERYTLISLIKMFLSGTVQPHLYYCVLYFFFILITPFVVKRMEHKIWNIVFYTIMPVWFIIINCLRIKFDFVSHWGTLPFTWFLYFYLGLKMKEKTIYMHAPVIVVLICIGFLLQLVEASVLLSITDNISFSANPARLSSIFYILPVLLLLLRLKESQSTGNNIFVLLGNTSFGIYLSHIVVLTMIRWMYSKITPVMQYNATEYILYVLIITIVTLFINYVIIIICQRFIPEKLLKSIGLS